jgi:hypothetical protein
MTIQRMDHADIVVDDLAAGVSPGWEMAPDRLAALAAKTL